MNQTPQGYANAQRKPGLRPVQNLRRTPAKPLPPPTTAFDVSLAVQKDLHAKGAAQKDRAARRRTERRANPSPERFAQTLVQTMERLVALMDQENQMVKERKIQDVKTLLPQKNRLVESYVSSFKTLQDNPDILKKIENKDRQSLQSLAQKLDESARKNSSCLRGAVEAVKRTINIFIDMVRKQNESNNPSYANILKSRLGLTKRTDGCQSFSLNQTA